MSFPYHDPFWVSAADWVHANAKPGERILAPDIFWWRFAKIYRYNDPCNRPDATYDWAILHKGMLEELPLPFLQRVVRELRPLFANEVFVVWGNTGDAAALSHDDSHLLAFFERVDHLALQDAPAPRDGAARAVLPDPGSIARFAALSDDEFVAAMDAFWTNGGYAYDTARDKAYYREIDRYIATLIGNAANRDVLDLCCGRGRLGRLMAESARVTGIDLSPVAVDLARRDHAGRDGMRFAVMDGHRLEFPDASFDDVLLVDAIEHVRDPQRVLAEAARVLRPGGRFLVSAANRDSVNQVLTRKLGYVEFVTNYQHFREFAYAEMVALLETAGLAIVSTAGIFLYPYWGVPGIDALVRHIEDDDEDFVELMRKLGERVGAEHAYASFFLARRPD